MVADVVVVRGVVKADGHLEVPGPVALPPGPVEVTVRAMAKSSGEDLQALLTRIHAEQKASGRTPRTVEEIDADIRQMHDEWETRRLGVERLQDECRSGTAVAEPST